MENEERITLGRAIDIVYDQVDLIARENFDAANYIRNIANNYE